MRSENHHLGGYHRASPRLKPGDRKRVLERAASGALIVYTSADSVFQIAAHEKIIPPEELYEICRMARSLLVDRHGVARVIARPFAGPPGSLIHRVIEVGEWRIRTGGVPT